MNDKQDESRKGLAVITVSGQGLMPEQVAGDDWETMLEQSTPIPNRLIFSTYSDDSEGFKNIAALMALAFFNRTNKVVIDGKPVYVQEAVPLMEQSNERLLQQLEYAEFSGDVPLSQIKERWHQESYKIEKPGE